MKNVVEFTRYISLILPYGWKILETENAGWVLQ